MVKLKPVSEASIISKRRLIFLSRNCFLTARKALCQIRQITHPPNATTSQERARQGTDSWDRFMPRHNSTWICQKWLPETAYLTPPPYFLAPAQVARGFSPFTADTSFGLPFWTRVIYLGGSLGFPAVRHLAHRQSCNLYTRLGRLHNTFSASVLGNGFQYQNLVWYGMASSSRYFHLAS
jgi:hypothetical protein